jgi:hypothetical protein
MPILERSVESLTTPRGPADVHVHLYGNGKGGMDCWRRRRWIMEPFLWAGARDIGLKCGFHDQRSDQLYLDQLLHWVSQSSLEAAVLLACDWVRDDQGAIRKELSDLFVSNDEVLKAVKRSSPTRSVTQAPITHRFHRYKHFSTQILNVLFLSL